MLVMSWRQLRWLLYLAGATLFVVSAKALPANAKALGADPAEVGEWSCCVLWPVNATHAVLLPTGKLLFWRTAKPYLWDPATENVSAVTQPSYNIFCSGEAFTGDGNVLLAGGAMPGIGELMKLYQGQHVSKGNSMASRYDPISSSWTNLPLMNAGRWYPTNTTLPNGDVLTISGRTATFADNTLPQVWQVKSGTWRDLTGAMKAIPLYPWMFVAPSGDVFMAGPDTLTQYVSTTGTGSWSVVGPSNWGMRIYGTAVMYDEGKVLIAGGHPTQNSMPTNTAEVIDLQAGATWRFVAPMAEARIQLNATLLPDGKVLVTGGHQGTVNNDPTKPVYLAEMWDPQTETWTSMASMAIFRGYHSTATLLPDGRVAVAGGDGGTPPGHNREIYSPPYLFKGPRPAIVGAPATVRHGQTFFVETPDAAGITSVNWLANGSSTHALNMGQRINRLTFSQAPGGLNVTAPANANLCPPGPYMLFILTGDGVPSVAAHIMVGVNTAPVANDDAYSTDEDTPLAVPAPGILGNDADAEADALTAVLVSGPSNAASFTLNADGSFDYTPAAGFSGTDSFTYEANDGALDSNETTVTVTVGAP